MSPAKEYYIWIDMLVNSCAFWVNVQFTSRSQKTEWAQFYLNMLESALCYSLWSETTELNVWFSLLIATNT